MKFKHSIGNSWMHFLPNVCLGWKCTLNSQAQVHLEPQAWPRSQSAGLRAVGCWHPHRGRRPCGGRALKLGSVSLSCESSPDSGRCRGCSVTGGRTLPTRDGDACGLRLELQQNRSQSWRRKTGWGLHRRWHPRERASCLLPSAECPTCRERLGHVFSFAL